MGLDQCPPGRIEDISLQFDVYCQTRPYYLERMFSSEIGSLWIEVHGGQQPCEAEGKEILLKGGTGSPALGHLAPAVESI